MSGGHFDYAQYKIEQIADQVEQLIIKNEFLPMEERYTTETINQFRSGLRTLRMAYVYAQRIDWLVSCDDGEEAFHRRLMDDLRAVDGFTQTFEHLEQGYAKLLIRIMALEEHHKDDNK